MNSIVMKNVIRFAAASGAVLTMIFSPLAMGLQSEDTLKKQIEAFMSETQLNKQITYKEFWNKTKHLYSGQVYKDVERYLMTSPNELMPEFALKESLSSTGEKIPTLAISENGKSHTMQIFGEKAKFAKFNNVILTENDVMLITPALKRLMASDIKIKKEHDQKLIKTNQNKITEFPALDKKTWQNMSQKERAMYVLLMRQTWSDARRVLEIIDLSKPATVAPKKKTSKLENLIKLLQSDLWAAGRNGYGCLVMGYVSEYKDGICSVKKISTRYPNEPLVQKSMEACAKSAPGSLSCNPYIYGAPNGNPVCVKPDSRSSSSFQYVSHAKGECDFKSPLGKPSDFQFLINPAKTGPERYAISNLKKDAQGNPLNIKEEFKKQQLENTKYVEDYLKGILKFNTGKDVNFNEALSKDDLAALMDVKEQFDDEILGAVTACKADSSKQQERNFWEACDQMQRRFLFVAEFLSKKPGCIGPDGKPNGQSVNASLKCTCASGDVNPGAKCEATVVTPPVNTPPIVVEEPTPTTRDEKCPNDAERDEKGNCPAGFNWKPWLIGAGLIGGAALLYHLFKKKNKPNQPLVVIPPQGCTNTCTGNTIQNPTTCACDPVVQPPLCSAPQVLNGGVCGCPTVNACTPGQQIYNLSTCQCDTVVQPGVCGDGVTSYFTPPGPSSCPAPTVCQNGTQVYPPATCPPVNEGGSGDNCPSGDCNGGVPTAN